MSRKVTVYSTSGKRAEELQNVNVGDWSGLKSVLREMNINYSGLKAVVGETRVTLESDKAMLPDGDFTLFLMPVKTKSGADRKELMEEYKALGDGMKKFLADKGLQVTRTKTEDLENYINQYKGNVPAPAKRETIPEKIKPIEGNVSSAASAAANATSKKIKESGLSVVVVDVINNEFVELENILVSCGSYDEAKPAIDRIKMLVSEGESALNKMELSKKEALKKLMVKKLDEKAHEIAKDFSDLAGF